MVRRSVATIRMFGGFLDGETDKKKSTARQNRTFRLSEYELRKLSEDAKSAGMNESKYLRELIVHCGVDATYAEDRRNLIRQISGIATNINQIAKHCNESRGLVMWMCLG